MTRFAVLAIALLPLGACSALLPYEIPEVSPPLADMEEPLALFVEPEDEEERRELDPGSFTGVEVGLAKRSLDDERPGLAVRRIVENSPADIAGLEVDDVLLFATGPDGEEVELDWPSQWRSLEIATPPDREIEVVYDRAGVERGTKIRSIPRVRPPDRAEAERFREESRVGVVLRTATEVEARRAGLGPGGGAVIVGLSLTSPFRDAGLRFGDLLLAIGGRSVDHPQVVLDAIREGDETIEVTYLRRGKVEAVESKLSLRASEVTKFYIPLLIDYENDRGSKDLSLLIGVIRHRTTPAAWDWRIFWLIRFAGGDADRLQEVKEE